MTTDLPQSGQWPADPQEDQPILDSRIWIDGCFDFFHHGHAGVMLQARQLGHSLHVGIHSDEEILANKGPPVMNLAERVAAADACRWVTQPIPHAPYVTDLGWISHYGCRYVVHGDDITSDAGGEDCYRFVKQANRFKVVKRTPGISTTDLVGRMLLGSREHFIPSLRDVIRGDKTADAPAMRERMTSYASDASGLAPGVNVYMCSPSLAAGSTPREHSFESFITGIAPHPDQRIVYVDGGFDLFCSGHISFLLSVVRIEEERAKALGWSHDYSPCHVVAGIHDDLAINAAKGENYPIMNIFERGLCLLQCKYVNTVIFSAPLQPSSAYLHALPSGPPAAVYHGSTSYMPTTGSDPYADAKAMGIFEQVPEHDFQDVDASTIVARIMDRKDMFVERQRRKEGKATVEAEVKRKEAGG